MPRNQGRGTKLAALTVLALAAIAGDAAAQTPVEASGETGFQLDFHVSEAALASLLPPGFTSSVAKQGPAKEANLRVIFLDRITITTPAGKPIGSGSNRFVYLVAPVKDTSGAEAQLVVGGLSEDAADVPGAFGVYLPASTHMMHRSVSSGTGPISEIEDWQFAAPTGEHLEMHIKFDRGVGFKLGPVDIKFYSAKNPGFYQISRQEQHLDILRNMTTNPTDRVKEFSFHGGGGTFAKLFDGKEIFLSWDDLLWVNRTILLP